MARYNVNVSPDTWVLPNRSHFINWVDKTFKYAAPPKVQTCPKCDEEAEGECPAKVTLDSVSLFPHQNFVKDYMQFASPYRGLLLLHFLGSGKTCSSIAAAEILMNHMDVVIMLPASLRDNYVNEIKKCGSKFFSPQQHWSFVKSPSKETLQELKIAPEFAKKQKGIWVSDTKLSANFGALNDAQKAQINAQLSHMIENRYQFINYNGLQRKHIQELVKDGNPFDNKVVIVDEIHNLVSRIVNGRLIGSAVYKLLMAATNCKLILLSGTPIINYPFEIAYVVNLLAGPITHYEIKINKTSADFNKDAIEAMLLENPYVDDFSIDISKRTITIQLLPVGFHVVDRMSSKISRYDGTHIKSHGVIVDEIHKALQQMRLPVAKKIGTKTTTLLPDKQDEFNELFVDEATGNVRNPRMFMKRILGTVSYYNTFSPELFPSSRIKEVGVPMTTSQFNMYEKARADERKKERRKKNPKGGEESSDQVYRFFSRAICNFVFPEAIKRPFPSKLSEMKGEIDADEDELAKLADEETEDKAGKANLYAKLLKECLQTIRDNKDEYLSATEVGKYSGKYEKILKKIQTSPGNVLVYSQFRNVEGLGLLGMTLETNGWAQFKIKKEGAEWTLDVAEEDLDKPKYATFTGNNEESRMLLKIFNNDFTGVPASLLPKKASNLRGDILKVMMITQSGAEGISLKNTRQVHIMEPYWNHIRMDQVIGRAVRTCSHVDLPADERNVDVFIYFSTLTEEQQKASFTLRTQDKGLTSDEYLFGIAKKKKKITDGILELLKKASVDCALNANVADGLKCFAFPVNMGDNKFVIHSDITFEETDVSVEKGLEKATWNGTLLRTSKGNFLIKEGTDDVYDYDIYIYSGRILKIGKIIQEGNKKKIVLN
jgi:hypothetical protein